MTNTMPRRPATNGELVGVCRLLAEAAEAWKERTAVFSDTIYTAEDRRASTVRVDAADDAVRANQMASEFLADTKRQPTGTRAVIDTTTSALMTIRNDLNALSRVYADDADSTLRVYRTGIESAIAKIDELMKSTVCGMHTEEVSNG